MDAQKLNHGALSMTSLVGENKQALGEYPEVGVVSPAGCRARSLVRESVRKSQLEGQSFLLHKYRYCLYFLRGTVEIQHLDLIRAAIRVKCRVVEKQATVQTSENVGFPKFGKSFPPKDAAERRRRPTPVPAMFSRERSPDVVVGGTRRPLRRASDGRYGGWTGAPPRSARGRPVSGIAAVPLAAPSGHLCRGEVRRNAQ